MKFPGLLISTISLSLALSIGGVYADEHKPEAHDDHAKTETHEHEHEGESPEQHGPHEHGAATLSLAAGAEGLEIALESPAANLLGFEHEASSDEDKKKLADAKAKLEAGAELFGINPEAECTLKSATVVSPLLGNANADEGEKKDEHADHEHEKGETHNDMDASWSYTCAKPEQLKSVSVQLFSAFPDGFKKINAEWVTEKSASAQELVEDSTISLD